jgi:CRP/FNR family cyclic AMP-dependent transcriptional regulator
VKEELAAEFGRRFPQLATELGDDLGTLLGACTVVEVSRGRKLFRDRMPVDSLYLILEGEMTVSVEEERKTLELAKVKPGDWLGEVSVLSGDLLASSTVTALNDVRVLRLRHQTFEGLLVKNQPIASAMLKQLVGILADRLRATSMTAGQPLAIRMAAILGRTTT